MNVGRMIFYDNTTGSVIVDTGEWQNAKAKKTAAQQISTYQVLADRARSSFDVLELDFGAYRQDFTESAGFRVNPATKALEFTYPDASGVELYQAPLSEQLAALKAQQALIQTALDDLIFGGGM